MLGENTKIIVSHGCKSTKLFYIWIVSTMWLLMIAEKTFSYLQEHEVAQLRQEEGW